MLMVVRLCTVHLARQEAGEEVCSVAYLTDTGGCDIVVARVQWGEE